MKNNKVVSELMTVMIAAGMLSGCGNMDAASEVAVKEDIAATEPQMSQEEADAATEPVEGEAPAIYEDNTYDSVECKESSLEGYVEDECLSEYAKSLDCPFPYDDHEYNTESYESIEENEFNLVQTTPLSTFAADVDTASYANVRRMIENGYSMSEINADAVRTEEFLNYFSYDLNAPKKGDKFGFTTEVSNCPWNEEHKLMFVGMKTQDIDLREIPDSNLVFLIDVSGSMDEANKLPLLQKSFNKLVDELPGNGTVSIVTYSGSEEVVLSGESMENKEIIKEAIDSLSASGCTNGESGIQQAYKIAKKYYIDGGNNRVILATDGDLNVGIQDPDELEKFISKKKDDGIFLSVLGFGDGNYKDDNLERIADCGNGNYSYIDSVLEAQKVLVDEMGGTLLTVAKDVKLQVEFNPAVVNSYRLLGYENRVMADADFTDDSKDGGEIGAGHSVVALYEFVPADSENAINLKYGDAKDLDYGDEYATLSVRYKEPEKSKSEQVSVVIDNLSYKDDPGENIKFAALVAEFAMILRDSDNKGTATLEDIISNYPSLEARDEYRDEFYQMVRMVAKRG